jgi:hypothetical protein
VLQVLEAVLPDTPRDMLQLVLRHKQGGPSSRFATCQLVLIAAESMVRGRSISCNIGPFNQRHIPHGSITRGCAQHADCCVHAQGVACAQL